MNTETFWKLIQKSRRGADDCSEQTEQLIVLLEQLEPDEIIRFHHLLWERLIESYRYDLWAVAYIVNGGCSDDGFDYFRGWLVAQGKSFFERVLQDPKRIVQRVKDEEVECEDILYAALQAYENRTGTEMPSQDIHLPLEPRGNTWKEEDLETLYPTLWKRFN
jgi:hypothetical protein